ncbi:MAG TPA: 16S rRNA (cytosine(967)-C(5))-methyltransferase [Candidatus Mediterraneibacter ornithocaccae]|nr:16S rRNA (cytosine(967)-C(5))-methyltransferase [Candidatus Mediterraneibacter ornithocaccae]
MTKPVNEREIVLEVLLEITEKGQFSHIILRDVLWKYQYLEKRERAFITRVTEGTLEHMIEIDYILDRFSKVKVKKMKPVIRAILRSAVYQLKYMDSVPDSAVCNEAVKLAVRKGFSGLKGYVNGVLRSVARGIDSVQYPKEKMEELSVRYSCPEWVLDLWSGSYDIEVIEMMLRDFQKEKPVTIRCCLNRTTPDELKKRLEAEGVKAEIHPYLPYAFQISGYDHLNDLETFQDGLFVVQDISSMLVAEIAAPSAGAQVLDVCAAPGGKALHVAEKLFLAEDVCGDAACAGNKSGGGAAAGCGIEDQMPPGHVEARDLTELKVDLIRENIERTGLPNITAVCRDASVPDETAAESADIVIADLPCSGLGVIGKKPDLRYKASPDGIDSLVRLQRQILSCAQDYVKPGGTLVYSTCTVNPAENMDNVHWLMEQYPEFILDDIREKLCPELRDNVMENGCIQLLPGVHKSDGFFIARLVRKIESGGSRNI